MDFFSKCKHIFDTISGGTAKIKFVLKDEIKSVPGLGELLWHLVHLMVNCFIIYFNDGIKISIQSEKNNVFITKKVISVEYD